MVNINVKTQRLPFGESQSPYFVIFTFSFMKIEHFITNENNRFTWTFSQMESSPSFSSCLDSLLSYCIFFFQPKLLTAFVFAVALKNIRLSYSWLLKRGMTSFSLS